MVALHINKGSKYNRVRFGYAWRSPAFKGELTLEAFALTRITRDDISDGFNFKVQAW